jgi:Type IV secretion system pilin
MFKNIILSLSLLFIPLLQFAPAVSAQQVTKQIQSGLCSGSNLEITDNPNVNSCNSGPNGVDDVNRILSRIVNFLSALVGVVAVIMIIIGGFRYITSGGNDTSVTSAKNTILYAVIGLVIVALAQILVRFVLDKIVNS